MSARGFLSRGLGKVSSIKPNRLRENPCNFWLFEGLRDEKRTRTEGSSNEYISNTIQVTGLFAH